MCRGVCHECLCTYEEDTYECNCIEEKGMKIELELTGEQIDEVVITEMEFFINQFEKDIKTVYKFGKGRVFHSDKKADIEELEKHIDAFKVVLSFYTGENRE
jgi:hypothetical protein